MFAVSDAAVAGFAAHAALHSALLNVRINVKNLPNDDWTQQTMEQVEQLLSAGDALQAQVQEITDSILQA